MDKTQSFLSVGIYLSGLDDVPSFRLFIVASGRDLKKCFRTRGVGLPRTHARPDPDG